MKAYRTAGEKRAWFAAAAAACLLIVVACTVIFWPKSPAPDGMTIESREQILRGELDGKPAAIVCEKELDGHLVCGVTAGGRDGIAIFRANGTGGYDYTEHRMASGAGKIVIYAPIFELKDYCFIWLNRENLDYADVAVRYAGRETHEMKLSVEDSQILYFELEEATSRSMNVIYYDKSGAAFWH